MRHWRSSTALSGWVPLRHPSHASKGPYHMNMQLSHALALASGGPHRLDKCRLMGFTGSTSMLTQTSCFLLTSGPRPCSHLMSCTKPSGTRQTPGGHDHHQDASGISLEPYVVLFLLTGRALVASPNGCSPLSMRATLRGWAHLLTHS